MSKENTSYIDLITVSEGQPKFHQVERGIFQTKVRFKTTNDATSTAEEFKSLLEKNITPLIVFGDQRLRIKDLTTEGTILRVNVYQDTEQR